MTLVRPVLNGAINLLGAAGIVSLAQAGYKAAGDPFFAKEVDQPRTIRNFVPKVVYGFFQVLQTSKTALTRDLVTEGCTYLALNILAQTIVMKKFPWNAQDLKIPNSTQLAKRIADVAILFFKSTSLIRLAQGVKQLFNMILPVSFEETVEKKLPILKPLHSKDLIIEGFMRGLGAEVISYYAGYDCISLNTMGLATITLFAVNITKGFWTNPSK